MQWKSPIQNLTVKIEDIVYVLPWEMEWEEKNPSSCSSMPYGDEMDDNGFCLGKPSSLDGSGSAVAYTGYNRSLHT